MRQTITAGNTLEIKANGANKIHLALLSGEVIYRTGDNTFNDTNDPKLTEDIRTVSVRITGTSTLYVKAISNSEIQYAREV